jgi:hypothetical protein
MEAVQQTETMRDLDEAVRRMWSTGMLAEQELRREMVADEIVHTAFVDEYAAASVRGSYPSRRWFHFVFAEMAANIAVSDGERVTTALLNALFLHCGRVRCWDDMSAVAQFVASEYDHTDDACAGWMPWCCVFGAVVYLDAKRGASQREDFVALQAAAAAVGVVHEFNEFARKLLVVNYFCPFLSAKTLTALASLLPASAG